MLSQIIKIYSDFSTCGKVGFVPLTHISCLNWGEAHIRNHNPIASGRSIPDKHCFFGTRAELGMFINWYSSPHITSEYSKLSDIEVDFQQSFDGGFVPVTNTFGSAIMSKCSCSNCFIPERDMCF